VHDLGQAEHLWQWCLLCTRIAVAGAHLKRKKTLRVDLERMTGGTHGLLANGVKTPSIPSHLILHTEKKKTGMDLFLQSSMSWDDHITKNRDRIIAPLCP
jgi:hypothetical protein